VALGFDDSDWKKALFVMASDMDWKKICMLLAQEDPAKLYDLAMSSLCGDSPVEKETEEDKLKKTLLAIIKSGNFISAIKEYRAWTGLGLKESKKYIDTLREECRLSTY